MPSSDFSSHDPAFSPEQVAQCARVIDGIRKLNARIVRLSGSLDAVTQARALQSFRFAFDRDHPNGVLPFNPATGEFNPIAPKLAMAVDGNKLVTHSEFSNCYESGPGTVQRGMVAAVYDQLLAYAVMASGRTGPMLWLKVSYLKPTPINRRLRFECAVASIDARKFSVTGSCHHGDEKRSEAEALLLAAYPLEVTRGGGRA